MAFALDEPTIAKRHAAAVVDLNNIMNEGGKANFEREMQKDEGVR